MNEDVQYYSTVKVKKVNTLLTANGTGTVHSFFFLLG